jgi:predicted transcriptional regulator YdeE
VELHLTFADLPELHVLVAQAETFPGGVPAAWARVKGGLDSPRGRKFYGVSFSTPTGVDYYAGVVPESEEEGARLGLAGLTIPAGSYAKTTLLPWEEHEDEIGPLVDHMVESVDYDPSRPVLEFYKSALELTLLVPVG